jgi:hypothetical protein
MALRTCGATGRCHFPPTVNQLKAYIGIPEEDAESMDELSEGGKRRLPSVILERALAERFPEVVKQIRYLHHLEGTDYLSDGKLLLVNLWLCPEAAQLTHKIIWLGVREFLLKLWIGNSYNEAFAWKDEKGTMPIKIGSVDTFPGTDIIKWMSVRAHELPISFSGFANSSPRAFLYASSRSMDSASAS